MRISPKQLDSMRAFVNGTLPDTCTIRAYSSVSDGAGGLTNTLTVGVVSACRIDPSGSSIQLDIKASGERLRRMWMITLPATVVISKASVFTINGANYEPIKIYDGHSWDVSSRAEIVETE